MDKTKKNKKNLESNSKRQSNVTTSHHNQSEININEKKNNDISTTSVKSNKRKFSKLLDDEKSDKISTTIKTTEESVNSVYSNEKTVYVEGLPFTANEDMVREFFSAVGNVKSIRLPKWQDSGRLRGYGHVEFDNADSAERALTLDGGHIGNRFIKVDRPLTPKIIQRLQNQNIAFPPRPPGCRSVFIKNLWYDCSELEIREAMMVCGPIVEVRLAMWGHTKQLKGFGYVDFKREDSAEIAVKKSGKLMIRDRPIIIDYETGAPRKGFKGPTLKR